MKIYPKTEHLKIPMRLSSLLGIFPWEFMFKDNKSLQRCYAIYSRIMLAYIIFFVATAWIKLFIILSEENPAMAEISGNLCITLIYTVTIMRQLIIRSNPAFKNIIKEILHMEMVISVQSDDEVRNIYNDTAKESNRNCKTYVEAISLVTILYLIRPQFQPGYEKHIGNQTVYIKSFPLSSWFPFDEQTYYLPAYLWSNVDALVGASFLTYTDIFIVALVTYATGQIKILHHFLKNFEVYKQRVQIQLKIEDSDTAAYVTFRECIQYHKKIIKYINNFNDSMDTLMLCDFLQSSLQVAAVLTQLLGNEITIMFVVLVGLTFLSMLIRLILYYYYANEVLLLSEGLSSSIWESNWYDQSPKIKFMMLFFIMRTRRSLKLKLGIFGIMSLDSFIAILKATYSCIMVMNSRSTRGNLKDRY